MFTRSPTRRAARRMRLLTAACAAALGALVLVTGAASSATPDRTVPSIELSGTIDPATSGWLEDALDDAAEAGAPLAVIRLDTPGGLDTSMREMVRAITAAPMPVTVYVSPNGARAASAGLFVTLAGDVAAMAPETNIGAASPIAIGTGEEDEVLGRKVENDAAAYARALAEGHGRNADLAEEMVRDATSVTAQVARDEGLVDLVAPTEDALLERLDGFRMEGPKEGTLATGGLSVERVDAPLHVEVRQLLVNPTVAYLLLIGGLLAIGLEVLSPGLVGPGLFGAVAFVLGLYGTAQLPVTAAGLLLLALALGLLLAETQVGSGGLLGGAGVAALVAAGLLLFDTGSAEFGVSVPVVAAVGALLGGLTLFIASKALATRKATVRGGAQDLLGDVGEARTAIDPVGQVHVHGELWRARASVEAEALEPGRRVRVEAVDGLTLIVRPIPIDLAPEPATALEGPTPNRRETP